MADKRKAKGSKPTGQRKSATQGTPSQAASDHDKADKENAVTSASQRPRPRPIKKSVPVLVPAHTERNNIFRRESDGDEGAAMAVEALLSIQKGNHFPPAATKARSSSPIEDIFQRVVPESTEDEMYASDGIEDAVVGGNLNDQDDTKSQSSDEDDGEHTDQLHELFDVPFEVPFENATRNLSGITSHTLFNEFLNAVAKRMETRLSLLARIAYIPSYISTVDS